MTETLLRKGQTCTQTCQSKALGKNRVRRLKKKEEEDVN
jgi:hypothetical protein